MSEPTVAVVIAAHNAERTLSKCIESVLDMDYPSEKLEVVVVNDDSSDATGEILARYAERIAVFETDKNVGPSVARNIGVGHTAADYVCFTDADCTVAMDWVRQLLEAFGPGVGAVGGTQLSPDDETRFGRSVQKFLATVGFVGGYTRRHRAVAEVDHNPCCNVMYRREVFEKAGGFLPGLWPGEDVELDLRVRSQGHKILFVPSARVYHYRPATLGGFSRMMRNYGRWSGGYLTRKRGFYRRLSYEPLGLAAVLVGALAVWRLLGIEVLGAGLLLAGVMIVAVFRLATTRTSEALLLALLFAVTVVQWNAGFCVGLFSEPRDWNG